MPRMNSTPEGQELRDHVGARLREVREKQFNASRRELAEAIVLDAPSAYSRIIDLERGRGSVEMLYKVLKYYHDHGVDLNFLFNGEGAPVSSKSADDYVVAELVESFVGSVEQTIAAVRLAINDLDEQGRAMKDYLAEPG